MNLDTFGSVSGLLDLSLQADDTSLGGILDEIYTPGGGEGKARPTLAAEERESARPLGAAASALLALCLAAEWIAWRGRANRRDSRQGKAQREGGAI